MNSKIHLSWENIHNIIDHCGETVEQFAPQVVVALGRGAVSGARLVCGQLDIPFYYVGLQLYDKNDEHHKGGVKVIQWLGENEIAFLRGKRVLLVDDIDDTGTTLRYCKDEFAKLKIEYVASYVIVKKIKGDKSYKHKNCFYGVVVDDRWVVFPWEAKNYHEHKVLAQEYAKECEEALKK
jgi:hypoxanthine phosphoribosyltransferase